MNQHTKSRTDGGDGLAEAPTRPQFVVMAHDGRAIIGVAGGSDVVAIVEPNYLEYAMQFAAAPDLLTACEAIAHATKLNDPALGAVANTLAEAAIKKVRGQ